jgi:hypothetical protein
VTNAADSGPGTLRAALTAATNGDVINFALPTPTNITLTSGELVVTSSVSILGPGPGLLSVNGNFPNTTNRVFHVMGGVSASLVNLAVTNGRALGASDLGGGIYIQGSSLLISNCVLSGNAADSGGAIYNDGFGATAALTLVNSTITGNSAIFGGGLSSEGFGNTGAVTVVSSTFSSNTATNAGNALGGAIYNRAVGNGLGKITIETSTFYGNSSQSGGGAIANDPVGAGSTGSVRINASTFSGNSASVGGAIDNLPETGGTATLEIGDTLFNAGNSGGTIANNAGTVTSRGFNLSSDAAGGDGTTGPGGLLNAFGDIRNTDPLLDSAGLQGNGGLTVTVALQPTSPALDKGNRAALADLALNIDQRGFSRPVARPPLPGATAATSVLSSLPPPCLLLPSPAAATTCA